MFTGLVEATGTVLSLKAGLLRLRPTPRLERVAAGESLCVDGVCLTVEGSREGELSFRLLPETLRATTLGSLRAGGRVNLERAVKAGSRLGGHLLLGHVDGLGKILLCERRGKSRTLELSSPEALAGLCVPKGPIAVDGVSLTLDSRVERTRLRVHLVHHTLSATTLGRKKAGDPVNLEADLIAKYLRGML